MTNLLATVLVCIVTNVTPWSNELTVPWGQSYIQPGGIILMPNFWGNGSTVAQVAQPATERTETTEVVEVCTLRFTWDDQEYTTERRRVLSTKVRRWKLQENWTEEQ